MSRDAALSTGSEEEAPSQETLSHAPHRAEEEEELEEEGEEEPALPDPQRRQEVTSPGAEKPEHKKEKEEEESSEGHVPHMQHSPLDPQRGQEVMSPGAESQEVQRSSEERCEVIAVGLERREKTSEQFVRRSVVRSVSSYPARERRGQLDEPRGPGPFYFFGGANGADIVSSYCESRGWKRIYNKNREDYKLKWCETKSTANYSNFRQGEQLVFQIPNNSVLTTKIGLLSSLREYERVSSKVQHGQGLRRLKMEEFIPTTFRMDMREEQEAFFSLQEGLSSNKQRHMWICKPTGLNQGRGIFLLKTQEDMRAFRHKLHEGQATKKSQLHHHRQPQARVVQKYIHNPLLLKGRKFDVRSYLVIPSTAPYMVFFRHGYVRLTCDLYDLHTSDMAAHLTNQYMQKKNPLYSLLKEDTVWSMESFNTYVNDRLAAAKGLPRDWVLGLFTKRMQQIMTQCFLSVKSKLDCRLGFFDLIGCDFMVDEDFNVWLLEMNCNPALHTNCSVLKEVIPSTVHETLDLTLEIFNKCRRGQRILPLSSQRDCVLLFHGLFPPNAALSCNKSRAPVHQKSSRRNQSEEPRPTRPLTRSVSAEGEEGDPCTAPCASPPQTLSSHKARKKKVMLKLSTVDKPTRNENVQTEELGHLIMKNKTSEC